jgi:chitinase
MRLERLFDPVAGTVTFGLYSAAEVPAMKSFSPIRLSQIFAYGVCASLVIIIASSVPTLAQDATQSKILAGYFEEWSIYGANYNIANLQDNGAANHISHLIYAFGNVAPTSGPPDAACQLADTWADYQTPYLPPVIKNRPYPGPLYGNFAALQQLKQLHPDLKIMISLGGSSAANTAGFSYAASTASLRAQLVSSCIDLFINGNVAPGISAAGIFDGFDIDWEFPAASDKHNFTLLLREFRKQLDALGAANGTQYQLSIFAPAGSQNYSNIELAAAGRQLDFLNVQSYDMHGSWESTTNHASPLYDSPADPTYGQGYDIEDTIAAYLAGGIPANKLLVGVPFYGYGWTGVPDTNHGLYQGSTGPAPSPAGDVLETNGQATYGTLQTQTGFTHYFDKVSVAQWIYNPTAQTFWTYDTTNTALFKMAYVNTRTPGGLGGAFFWAFKDDDAHASMVKAMAKGLGR